MIFHLCLLCYYVIHFNAHFVPPKTSLILLLHEYSFRSIHVFTTSIALHPFQHLHVSEIIFLLPEAPPLLSLLMEFASQVCYYEFVFLKISFERNFCWAFNSRLSVIFFRHLKGNIILCTILHCYSQQMTYLSPCCCAESTASFSPLSAL